jgi:rRNA maturation protein Nop10
MGFAIAGLRYSVNNRYQGYRLVDKHGINLVSEAFLP